MALIDIEELKEVLGIGDIYADSIVQEVADAAQNIILSYLIFNKAAIAFVKLENNVAIYTTTSNHSFAVGDSISISGCGSPFNGTKTITEKSAVSFKVAVTNADIDQKAIVPQGKAILVSQAALYDTTPEIREAALITAEDIWMTRMGVTGQQGVDFQPAPYRLSRGLITRITGLISKHMDMGSLVG
jgi:hypothetical protein